MVFNYIIFISFGIAFSFSGDSSVMKIVSKNISRTSEKMRTVIGKDDDKPDPILQEYTANFMAQKEFTNKLLKAVKTYQYTMKEMSKAHNQLTHLLNENLKMIFEDTRSSQSFDNSLSEISRNMVQYEKTITKAVVTPLISYENEFPHYQMRIDKLERKRLDLRRAKRNHQVALTSSKSAEKIAKTERAESEADVVYTSIHDDLVNELPAFYDQRVSVYCKCLANFFQAETNVASVMRKENKSLFETMTHIASIQPNFHSKVFDRATVPRSTWRQATLQHVPETRINDTYEMPTSSDSTDSHSRTGAESLDESSEHIYTCVKKPEIQKSTKNHRDASPGPPPIENAPPSEDYYDIAM